MNEPREQLKVAAPRRLNVRLLGFTILFGALALAVLLFYVLAYRMNASSLGSRRYTFRDLIRPTQYESLVGVDLGGADMENAEVLVTEAPDIDVIRAELRRETEAMDVDAPPRGTFLICDFDKDGNTEREWTCPVGSWVSDPTDPTIKFLEAYDPVNRHGEKGYCLKLWYDIDSPNPAYGGLWIQFKNGPTGQQTLDLSSYRVLSLMIKVSSGRQGGTTRLKMEMKNGSEVAVARIFGINGKWNRFDIPLSNFKEITDWSQMKEMTIVIDNEIADRKEGLLYFDDIMFTQ